jgi:hypothetical protein
MVKINVIGFKQFKEAFDKLPAKLQKETETDIRAAADQFRELAIDAAPSNFGTLRGQITVEKGEGLAWEVVSGSKYSAPMEFGTKGKFQPISGIDASEFKGKPTGGTYREMLKNIENWVHKKQLVGTYSVKTRRRIGSKKTQQSQNRQAAFLITRSILRNGVTPHPFFFRQIAPVRRDFFRRFRETLKTVMD